MSIASITPQELAEIRKANRKIELIDVRTALEYRDMHVEDARNIPLDELDPELLSKTRQGNAKDALYMICRGGGRGELACERLVAQGFSNVINIDGGTMACVEAGLPIVRGKKVVSLERQVRIAAGMLVFSGAILALLVHPAFVWLPAFVGAGLVFAGVTDTCAMGLLLARMPWNKCSAVTSNSCA